MEIITLLLVTEDIDYAKAFTRCISEDNPAMIFKVLKPTEIEKENELERFDIILADDILNIKKEYVLLTEKRCQSTVGIEGQKLIYKYDTAESLSKQLALIYCVKTGHEWRNTLLKNSITVLFCSAEGGTGKTAVALGLAQELARFHDKKVLYINYEEIESTGRYFEIQEEKSIANYLYYISKGVKIEGLIDSFTVCDDYGVRAFSPTGGRNQLKLLNIEEFSRFLNIIQEHGDFDYIFIDNDNSLTEENIWVISACDKICKVDRMGNHVKEDSFRKHVTHLLGEDIFNKIISIINFVPKDEKSTEEMEGKIFIEYDPKSFEKHVNSTSKEIINISLDREFGFGIKKLSTNLTLNLQ